MKEKKDIIINGRSLKDILDLHELFLISNGKEGERANLIGADLEDVNLEGANLKYADLIGTDLIGANLKYANLIGADLYNAYLKDANLYGAYLYNANLEDTNLEGANLIGANLFRAKLSEAKLDNVIYNHTTLFYALQCPEKGNFIAYKKAGGCIVKLEILESSKRSSATTRKCRCDKARVISIENIETGEMMKEVSSNRDENFIYKVGEVVSVDNFNEDRWVECTTGIHFFMTKHEAESYDV